jgi:sulfate/thiosulfate-binding protein
MGYRPTWPTGNGAIAVCIVAGVIGALTAGRPDYARAAERVELLNVSYDPTRELLRDIGAAFSTRYATESGMQVTVRQSHGGSSAQARAVIEGLEADVVTLALWPDTDAIRRFGLIAPDWETRFPNHSVPWRSTIVFVVRTGNPKGIKDWPDLVQPGVEIVTPNPKTSGNGKLAFLAAWGSVVARGGSDQAARDFVTTLYKQTPVLDSGARGAAVTFARRQIGDVHLAWETEARLEITESPGALEIVYPPLSILAEPPVAVVDDNVRRHGTRAAAEAYLNFLYTDEGQQIIAKHFYRPVNAAILRQHADALPDIQLFPLTALAKDWADAYAKFFADGQIFDSIYAP